MLGQKETIFYRPSKELVGKDEEQLLVMASIGDYYVNANSTYSWWAAYLAWVRRGDKVKVVMPTPWFGPNGPKTHNLYTAETIVQHI